MPTESRRKRLANIDFERQAQMRGGRSAFGELSLLSSCRPSEVVDEDLKKQMLCDPTIYRGLALFKLSVLADDMELITAVGKDDKRYAKAKRIRDFCQACVIGMDGSAWQKNYQFLHCAWDRNKVANIVGGEIKGGEFKGKIGLKRLQMLRKGSYSFVLDKYDNTLGVRIGEWGTAQSNDRLWPRRKLAIATFRPEDDLPIGTTLAEPAYFPYYIKQRVAEERLRNASQFGSPSLKGIQGKDKVEVPETVPMLDDDGQGILGDDGEAQTWPPAYEFRRKMAGFANGSFVALAPGEDLDILQAQNSGSLFHEYEVDANDAIISTFLGTSLMTEKAQQSLGSSQTGANTFGWMIRDGKMLLEELWYEDIFKSFVELSFGLDAVELTPQVSFGSNMGMMASVLNSLAAMASVGMVDEELRDFFWRKFGWPVSGPNAKPINNGVLTGNVKTSDQEDKAPRKDKNESAAIRRIRDRAASLGRL